MTADIPNNPIETPRTAGGIGTPDRINSASARPALTESEIIPPRNTPDFRPRSSA